MFDRYHGYVRLAFLCTPSGSLVDCRLNCCVIQDSAESLSTGVSIETGLDLGNTLLAYFPPAEFPANLSKPFGCSGRCGGGPDHLLHERLTFEGRRRVLSHGFDCKCDSGPTFQPQDVEFDGTPQNPALDAERQAGRQQGTTRNPQPASLRTEDLPREP